MAFQIPDGLAPEAYPLSWLLGRWRGPGFIAYPDIPQRGVLVDAEFSHDGGPYLIYTATTYLLESPLDSLEGQIDVASLEAGQVWGTESGYWRVSPAGGSSPPSAASAAGQAGTNDDGGAAGAGGQAGRGATGANGSAGGDGAGGASAHNGGNAAGAPVSDLEVLLAEPTGHVSVYLGRVQGPRVELTTDLIARTATGAEIAAASRMYGLVGGELFWATDMAAFGHELQSYSSGRLQRQE